MKTPARSQRIHLQVVPEYISKACDKIFEGQSTHQNNDTSSPSASESVPKDDEFNGQADEGRPLTLEERRSADLNAEIHQRFADVSERELEEKLAPCWESITEMIEITKVGREFCEAVHLFDDITFERIKFPRPIHVLIEPGDVFLVTLGKMEKHWDVYSSSPKYETEILEFENLSDDELH